MSKKIQPTSVNSTKLSASVASVSPILTEPWDLESCESVRMRFNPDAVEVEDSPYLEVRASAWNIDDPEMPALSFRMCVIGLVLCMIGSGLNVFFRSSGSYSYSYSSRTPSENSRRIRYR